MFFDTVYIYIVYLVVENQIIFICKNSPFKAHFRVRNSRMFIVWDICIDNVYVQV